ncbi:hypothetical protein GTR02_05445 [Kineococcus sp. R8]|uniref:hypothetical protein n=1 Tax=Kineococcus siccus TaxID=2696567 RepID=UPI00141328BA|nr:hypothetical protein [Kineococcus siccus]NAZ81255.1 hypothetical protein [Kineococcus siccus]
MRSGSTLVVVVVLVLVVGRRSVRVPGRAAGLGDGGRVSGPRRAGPGGRRDRSAGTTGADVDSMTGGM